MNISDNINKRIYNLTSENRDLEKELRRIKSMTNEKLDINEKQNKLIDESNLSKKDDSRLKDSTYDMEKTIRISSSLNELESKYLEDKNFLQINYIIIKAILLANNISLEMFSNYFRFFEKKTFDEITHYNSLLKYFLKLISITDLNDLFSLHIICVCLVNELKRKDESQFKLYLNKKLFFSSNLTINDHLTIVFQLKEVIYILTQEISK